MSACDFLKASCSSTEFHTVATSEIITSPSLPDVNDSSLHEAVRTVLTSWCPSLSRKHFAGGQKFRSPVSVALMVLKAQILALKRRVHVLEVECDSLKHSNGTLQSRNASLSGDLSRLRADYNSLLCDRKKGKLAAEQDQQKIRALTSDIDNAQQFIMAMVDIKLHENFLLVAANETMANNEDAERSLANAIAQEADREGSLWSRILSSVVDTNSYSAAVDLALQTKDFSLGDGLADGVRKTANVLHPPELHSVYRVTSESRERSCDLDGSSPFASPSKIRAQPPTPLCAPRQSLTMPIHRLSPASTAKANPSEISGLGIRYNRRISPPAQFATGELQATKISPTRAYSTPKLEDANAKPTRKRTALRKRSETQNQSHMKNSDKRKGIIITSDVAMASISVRTSCPLQKTETEYLSQKQKSVDSKGNTTLFTTLSSLERICASLSSSDLGSLEETSDDDESRSRASDDSGGSLDRPTVKVEPLGSPDTDTTAEKDQSSVYLVPDCPELSPSISTSPPSTPLGLAWSFYSEGSQAADTSPTSTHFSDIIPIVKQGTIVYEDSPSFRSSLNLSKFPVVSGFAKRLSRAITKIEDNSTGQCVPHVSDSSSLLGNTHLRSGSTTTGSKNTSPRISKSTSSSFILPGRQKPSTKSTTPSKKTTTPEKTSTVPEAPTTPATPPSTKRVKGAAETTPISYTSQESKFSMGRTFLRRLSNIPGTVSRTRFSPTTSESPKGTSAGPNRTRIFLMPSAPVPTKSQAQSQKATTPKAPTLTAAANGTTQTSANAVGPLRTKPRSNTINDYSPAKSSPLSQNVITASSGRPDSSSSWKRRSVQVILSTHTKGTTTEGARTDKTVPAAAAAMSPMLTERRRSTKRQHVKNGDLEPTMTPTAAFMKPVSKSAKVAKRMTNSIKPLIPTWNAGSSSPSSPQCSNMFRNSLSMIVR